MSKKKYRIRLSLKNGIFTPLGVIIYATIMVVGVFGVMPIVLSINDPKVKGLLFLFLFMTTIMLLLITPSIISHVKIKKIEKGGILLYAKAYRSDEEGNKITGWAYPSYLTIKFTYNDKKYKITSLGSTLKSKMLGYMNDDIINKYDGETVDIIYSEEYNDALIIKYKKSYYKNNERNKN